MLRQLATSKGVSGDGCFSTDSLGILSFKSIDHTVLKAPWSVTTYLLNEEAPKTSFAYSSMVIIYLELDWTTLLIIRKNG